MNPLPNDPNGEEWEMYKKEHRPPFVKNAHPRVWLLYGYTSYEAFIESPAGANPPDCDLVMAELLRQDRERIARDFPMPKPPPFAADDEGETAEEHYIRTCTGDAGNTTHEDDPAPRGDADA